MLRVNLLENTFNFPSVKYERVAAFLDKGRDYVVVTAIYSIIILAILFKYGKYFLP